MSEIHPLPPPSRPESRRATAARRCRPGGCALLVALLALAPLAVPNARAEEGGTATTLVLNQDSLGQTRDQILRAQGLITDTEQVEAGTAPDPSQAVSEEAAQSVSDDEEWSDVPDALADAEAQPQSSSLAVDATSCIEVSVRAGNGLNESTRVCRAVFPD